MLQVQLVQQAILVHLEQQVLQLLQMPVGQRQQEQQMLREQQEQQMLREQ